MNCKKISELLTAYLDGEVTPKERVYIEAHLPSCPQCRTELEALSATRENLHGVFKAVTDEVNPSPGAWEKIRTQLETGGKRSGFWSSFTLGRVVTASVAIVILVIAVIIWHFGDFFQMGSPPPATEPGITIPGTTPLTTPPPETPVPTTPPPGTPSSIATFERLPDVISTYGETVAVELVFTNESSDLRIISPYPPEIKIVKLPNLNPSDSAVRNFPEGSEELELQPGDSVTYSLNWDQKDDSGEQVDPGWYGVEVTLASRKASDATSGHVRGLATRVLVLPPQGVMEKTIEVNQSVTATGLPFTWSREEQFIEVTITLKRVEMTANGVEFTVLVTSPAYTLPQGPELAPPQWMLAAYAQYTIDGATKDAGVAGMRPLENGLQLQWGYEPGNIDPIPSDTEELTFTITSLGDWEGPWEFRIPLE